MDIGTIELARSLNLKVTTVQDLLRRGWSYEKAIDAPGRWVDPSARLIQTRGN